MSVLLEEYFKPMMDEYVKKKVLCGYTPISSMTNSIDIIKGTWSH